MYTNPYVLLLNDGRRQPVALCAPYIAGGDGDSVRMTGGQGTQTEGNWVGHILFLCRDEQVVDVFVVLGNLVASLVGDVHQIVEHLRTIARSTRNGDGGHAVASLGDDVLRGEGRAGGVGPVPSELAERVLIARSRKYKCVSHLLAQSEVVVADARGTVPVHLEERALWMAVEVLWDIRVALIHVPVAIVGNHVVDDAHVDHRELILQDAAIVVHREVGVTAQEDGLRILVENGLDIVDDDDWILNQAEQHVGLAKIMLQLSRGIEVVVRGNAEVDGHEQQSR